jgi:O-antigen/teichoic acid export membrane protein
MRAAAVPGVSHRDVARGAGAAFLARLGAVIEVVAQPAYVWMFGLATYGLYTVLWAWVNVVENLADLGMGSALQRTVPQSDDAESRAAALRAALLWGVGPCTAIALLTSIAAPWAAELVNVAPRDRPALALGIALFAWALPLWAFVEIGTAGLRARRAFGPEIRLRILWEQIIRLVLATTLWAAGVHTLGLIVAHLLSLTITAALSLRLLGSYYDLRLVFRGGGPSTAGRDTLVSGLALVPANAIARLFSDGPPVLLNLLIPGAGGATAAGLYGIARKLSSLVQMIRLALGYVMGPLASAVARHDRRSIEPLYGYATRLGTALAIPTATALVLGAPTVLLLFGPEAAGATALLIPLVIMRLVDAVTGPGGAIQQVASARYAPAATQLVGLAAAAMLLPVLLPERGAAGMALAVAAGLILANLATVAQLWWRDRLWPFHPPFPRTAAVALAVSIVLAAPLRLLERLPEPAALALLVLLLLASLWVSLRFALSPADRATLGKAGRRLRLG